MKEKKYYLEKFRPMQQLIDAFPNSLQKTQKGNFDMI